MSRQSFALRSTRVVTPQGIIPATIMIAGGTIAGIADYTATHDSVEDAGDQVVMPGLVDTHVHINDPRDGQAWEGFDTATRAAAAGGITTLVDMPLNSLPVTTTVASLAKKHQATHGKLHVDCGMYAGLVPGNRDDLPALLDQGVLGVKAFLIQSGLDEFPNVTENDLHAAMPLIARSGLPLLVHAEFDAAGHATRTGAMPDHRSYRSYLATRPRKWEQDAVELMIRLCREYNCRVHIVHLSSADAIPALKRARAEGLPITVETCPHYLFFTAEEIPDGDTRFKCAPPIREHDNRERLWQALADGDIDCIVSDHSPCPPEMKVTAAGDFQNAWGGIASLQLGLSVVWTEARHRGFTIEDIVQWMSYGPAKLVGLHQRKGALAAGYDADLVIWDPDAEIDVLPDELFHRHKTTPYDGKRLRGKVLQTYVRGTRIFHRGILHEQAVGHLLYPLQQTV